MPKNDVRHYISYGGGVNSTALICLLQELGIEAEIVFCDTGAEMPHTYEYIKYLRRKGFEITVLKPNVDGCSSLYEYCVKRGWVPLAFNRWCTK